MKQTLKSALLSAVLLATGICTVAADDNINRKTYENPVIPSSTPDPTIIKCEEDGFYYLYGTEDTRNMPIYRSKNLVDWIFVGTAFNEASRPACVGPNSGAGLWAPDINYINGQYVLYFSIGVWGQTEKCGVGVATSDRPEGPFVDRGVLFRSQDIGVTFSIDQFYIEDNGKKYLIWGSYNGIYMIELTDDGLRVKPGAQKVQLVGNLTEASYVYKRDGYYYLFGSTGTCCEGARAPTTLFTAAPTSSKGLTSTRAEAECSTSSRKHSSRATTSWPARDTMPNSSWTTTAIRGFPTTDTCATTKAWAAWCLSTRCSGKTDGLT